MRGTIDKDANVTVTFNCQCEALEAPDGKVYFPCGSCGKLLAVDRGTVSVECDECSEIRNRLGFVLVCPNGCRPDSDAPFKVDLSRVSEDYSGAMGVLIRRDYTPAEYFEDGHSRVTNTAFDIAEFYINQELITPVCVCCGAKACDDIRKGR